MSRTSQESNGDIGNTCKKLRIHEIDEIRDIGATLTVGDEAVLANGPSSSPAEENSHVIETSKAFKQLNVHYSTSPVEAEKEGVQRVAVVPPSPKKRKAEESVPKDESSARDHGVSEGEERGERKGALVSERAEANESSLAEVLVRFGDIELNKDFYDYIRKTESRCDLGVEDDVRENDRKAFSTAMGHVRRVIQEAVHAHSRDELPKELEGVCMTQSTIYQVLWLVSTSHEVIRFLVEMGGTPSASLTYDGSDLTDSKAKSFGKSVSQNINLKEKIVSSSADEGISPIKGNALQHHGKHPRQQRRDSSLVHSSQAKDSPRASDVASLISNDNPKRQRKNEDEACSLFVGEGYSETKDSPHEEGESNHSDQGKSSPGADESEKASLNISECDVASSKLYGPILSSLKWSYDRLKDVHGKGTEASASQDNQTLEFENMLSSFPATMEESKELADKVYGVTDSVYKDFDLQILPGTRIALVASAFESVIKSHIKDDTSSEITESG
ncbi:hypothetical protein M9435_001652 [Picochlorum sp. BPE23]|nr:hypothetical protein M9435_001652 [Picochlorum sp. BPE23]